MNQTAARWSWARARIARRGPLAAIQRLAARLDAVERRVDESMLPAVGLLTGIATGTAADGSEVAAHVGRALRERPGEPLVTVETDAGRLVLPAYDRFILPELLRFGRWEPTEIEAALEFAQPGSWVVNVGANVGYTTILLSSRVGPSGLVVAIEPAPANFSLLCWNIFMNGARNVYPVRAAAGDRTGQVSLAISVDNSGDHRTGPHPASVGKVVVPVVRVDDLLPPDAPVSVIFSDAQGSDAEVMAGLSATIARCRPVVFMEHWPPALLERGINPLSAFQVFEQHGYRIDIPALGLVDLSPDHVLQAATDGRDHLTVQLTPR